MITNPVHTICLALPFLRPGDSQIRNGAVLLWPGHLPEPPAGYWQPPNYPLGHAEARDCLEWFRNADTAELERNRSLLLARDPVSEAAHLDEMAVLQSFAADREAPRLPQLLLRQAQKALLLRWRQEELQQEIAELEAKCLRADRELLLRVLAPEDRQDREQARAEPAELPWRACVASALLFVPPEMPLLALGEMGRELAGLLGPETALARKHGFANCLAAFATAERVLGAATRRWPADKRGRPRLWLVETGQC